MKHARRNRLESSQRRLQLSEIETIYSSTESDHYMLTNKSLYRESLNNLISLLKQTFFVYVYCFILVFIASTVSSLRSLLMIGIILGIGYVAWDETKRLASTGKYRSKEHKNALLVEVAKSMNNDISQILYHLKGLTEEDIIWMRKVGSSKKIAPGEILIHEKQTINELYFVLSGTFEVVTTSKENFLLGKLDSSKVQLSLVDSQVIGEMSFVGEEGYLPSATVKAVKESYVWSVPKSVLEEKIAYDQSFGTRFYKILCSILASRLSSTNKLRAASESKVLKEQSWFSIFRKKQPLNAYPRTDLAPGMLLVMIDSCST